MTASTVNGLIGHTLFGVHWETALLITFVASTLVIVVKRKGYAVALVLGFIVSSALMDARSSYDDAITISRGYRPTAFDIFLERAAEAIGKGTWGSAPLDERTVALLHYRLAETPYAPEGFTRQADFWIATNPNDGQPYLVKKKQP
jgi:hypothetical protein